MGIPFAWHDTGRDLSVATVAAKEGRELSSAMCMPTVNTPGPIFLPLWEHSWQSLRWIWAIRKWIYRGTLYWSCDSPFRSPDRLAISGHSGRQGPLLASEIIRRAEGFPEVRLVRDVRSRGFGNGIFVDLSIQLDSNLNRIRP